MSLLKEMLKNIGMSSNGRIEIDVPKGYRHEHPEMILKNGEPKQIIINLKK